MYEQIQTGPVAIFARGDAELEACRAFVGRLGGRPEDARTFSQFGPVIAELGRGDLRVLVVPDDDLLFQPDGERVFQLAEQEGVCIATVFDTRIVEPDDATIAALLRGKPEVWGPLLVALVKGHLGSIAPASFIGPAAKGSPDIDVWTEALRKAVDSGRIRSEHVSGVLRPREAFADWFVNALVRSGPSRDPQVYSARLRQLEYDPQGEVSARCRELRDELAGLEGVDFEDVHLRACLVYTARLLEDGAWDDAEAAADDALAVARRHRDSHAELVARRLQVGAWLGRLELARAFEALDDIWKVHGRPRLGTSKEQALLAAIFGEPSGPGPVLATKRFFSGLPPLDDARHEVAFLVQGVASEADAEWRAALKKLAKALSPVDAAAAALVRARL